MKTWRCEECKKIRETEDDIVMVCCPGCMVEMEVEDEDI